MKINAVGAEGSLRTGNDWNRRTKGFALAALLPLLMLMQAAASQTFPNRPIRIIVPFAAGGSVDALGRLIAPKMGEALGTAVIVENRPGAGANIGADAVAKSAPDGHTLLLIPNALAIMPALYRKLPFDPARDFQPVSLLVATELVLVGSTKLPPGGIRELVALAKGKPGSLNFGSTGVANPLHLTVEMFKVAAGIDIVPIPYKGDAPLNAALLSGEVELAVLPLAAAQSGIRSGRLRALGITGASRSQAFPELPTIAEGGYPGFDSTSWQGLFVAAGTPRELVLRLQREAVSALSAPEARARLPGLGQEFVGSTAEAFDLKFRADMARFARIVREAKIPLQD
jgi:tripartite-type tricarboxylate transporter receptor subunit TctC